MTKSEAKTLYLAMSALEEDNTHLALELLRGMLKYHDATQLADLVLENSEDYEALVRDDLESITEALASKYDSECLILINQHPSNPNRSGAIAGRMEPASILDHFLVAFKHIPGIRDRLEEFVKEVK